MPTVEAVRADLPHIVTSLPGPRAKSIIERDAKVLSPSYTRCYPLVAETARGSIVEDPDGNRFLDLNAGIAVASTGHCHPATSATGRQTARLIRMSGTDFYYQNMAELAEILASIAPVISGARSISGTRVPRPTPAGSINRSWPISRE